MDFELNLDSETVEQAHPTEPLIVDLSASVQEVFALMRARGRGSVMICSAGGHLEGILTERDVVRLLAEEADLAVPVERVMVRNPVTVARDVTVGRAIALMAEGGYRRLPIVDDAGHPVGILGVSGVLDFLAEHFPQVVYTLPPAPHQSTREREGA